MVGSGRRRRSRKAAICSSITANSLREAGRCRCAGSKDWARRGRRRLHWRGTAWFSGAAQRGGDRAQPAAGHAFLQSPDASPRPGACADHCCGREDRGHQICSCDPVGASPARVVRRTSACLVAVVEAAGAVHRLAVVPHHQSPRPPRVRIDELALRGALGQVAQEYLRFRFGPSRRSHRHAPPGTAICGRSPDACAPGLPPCGAKATSIVGRHLGKADRRRANRPASARRRGLRPRPWCARRARHRRRSMSANSGVGAPGRQPPGQQPNTSPAPDGTGCRNATAGRPA